MHIFVQQKHDTFPNELMSFLWAPGALGPTLFRLCRRALRGFFSAKKASQQNMMSISKKISVFLRIFVILANVDLNLRLQIWKIAI